MASNSNALVSLSTEERPQMLHLSGSVPIRAPLTCDDDDDSDFDVSSNNATLSYISHDSDASETLSHLVADPEADDYYASEDEELSATPGVSLRVMPFAYLSTYDDGDDESEVEGSDDDDEVLSVVRVHQNSVGAPRVKVLDVEEHDAETLVSINSLRVSQSLLAGEFSSSDYADSVISTEEADDDIESSGIGKEVVVEEQGLDENLGDREVGYDECPIVSDNDALSPDNVNNEQFGKVRVVLNELEEEKLFDIEDDSIMQWKLAVETGEATPMVNGISIMVGDTSLLKSNVEDYSDGRMLKQNTSSVHDLHEQNSLLHPDFSMTGEPVSEAFAETAEYSTAQRSVANGSHGFVSDEDSECEKLVSITTPVINSTAKLHDSSSSFESGDDACEGKQIQCVKSSEWSDPRLLQETAYLENDLSEANLGVGQQDDPFCNSFSHEYVEKDLYFGNKVEKEATVELNTAIQESKTDGSASDEDTEGLMPVDLEQFKDQISALSILLGSKDSVKNCQQEQLVRSSDESDGSTVTVTSADESSIIFFKYPSSFSSLLQAEAGFYHHISEKEKEKIQRIQDLSVKFLRVVLRLNLSLEDSFISKVLCRLVADIEKRSNQEFVVKSAKVLAKKLEKDCEDDLDISLNILVLGKSGVGKSATINSIFGDMKVVTNAFEPATTSIKEVSGTVYGVKIRILDTPGLRSTMKEQAFNRKILSSIKRYMKKFPVDVILYVDRVDAQTRDLNDLPIFRSITSSLSPSIWQRTFLTLTHAASTPLDGPSGSPLSYELSVASKSWLVQQAITQAVGDLCQLSPSFMCPVSLVENHPLHNEFVLPNGLRWRSQLLALCSSLKILSEVSSVSGPQTLFDHWKQFFFQDNTPPLSHPLSSLLYRAHLKFKASWN